MLSNQSPQRIQKRPSRRDLTQSPTKSPTRAPRRQAIGMTNPLGLQHLTNILDQGPTLEPTGQYPTQHTMQEAQQHQPPQPGPRHIYPQQSSYHHQHHRQPPPPPQTQQQHQQHPQITPQMMQILQEQTAAHQAAQAQAQAHARVQVSAQQDPRLRGFYDSCQQYAVAGASPEQVHSPTMLGVPYHGSYPSHAQGVNYISANPATATAVPMSYYGPNAVAYVAADHAMQRVQHIYPPNYPQYRHVPATPSPCSSPVHMSGPVSCLPGQEGVVLMSPSRQGQYIIDSPMVAPMSPREAMLANMNVDASIEDTGISAEEVQSYMSEQDPTDQKWTCLFEDCGKKFGRKENIRSHVQTHLGDRQFKCNTCNKCFVRQHDLKRHAKIHSGHKPYVCPCGNGFARQDALTRHRQRGVCEGALPGCERREVKRGRPRKIRSGDVKSEDDEDEDEDNTEEGSSPESGPDTPTGDEYGAADAALDTYVKTYTESRSVSPGSPTKAAHQQSLQMFRNLDLDATDAVSPSARHDSIGLPSLSTGASTGIFSDATIDWGVVEPQPALCNDAFSPPALSSSALGEFEDDDSFLRDAFGNGPKAAAGDCTSLIDYNGDHLPSHLDAWLQC